MEREDEVSNFGNVKRVLITGANSFVGTSLEKHLERWPNRYHIDTIDVKDESWRKASFSGYDSVFHVAGIAHQDRGRLDESKKNLYYSVNTELAIDVAKKAKEEGVPHIVFMSSMIVYGEGAKIGGTRVISHDTSPSPNNVYGNSKLKADIAIR